jgi:TRAP-type C4-dicarboxylate transport system permease small subunit
VSALATWRRRVERLYEWISVALMVLLALEVLVGIVFRMAQRPLAWYDEVASVLLVWLTYYASALAALKRAHIGFPGLVKALPARGRIAALVLREIAVIGFFAILAWQGVRVLRLLAGETLVTVDVPVQLTQSVIPIGAVLFIIAELLALPEQIRAGEPAAAKELTH